MWRLLGKSAHLWPEWLYKTVSKIHSKIIKFNHSFLGEKLIGDHILLLETIGSKTNQLRKTPLTYANCENDYIVAASYSGNDKTPDWFYNLSSSNPYITINNERFEATYELIESSDKEYYWSLLDQVYPTFQMYRKRTDRDIPLIKFSKVEAL